MIYLAVPIKHPDPEIVAHRVSIANQVAARLHDAGIPVFSPASHSSGLVKHIAAPIRGWDYWSQIDLPILTRCCTRLAVLCLPGWRKSEGVSAEIKAAQEIGIERPSISRCASGAVSGWTTRKSITRGRMPPCPIWARSGSGTLRYEPRYVQAPVPRCDRGTATAAP